MKKILFFLAFTAILSACKNNTTNNTATATPQSEPDSTAIANTIHGFYKWYNVFSMDTTKQFVLTDENAGPHLKLNTVELKKYYTEIMKSGYVSEEFITNEDAFYHKCEQLWQNEDKADVPSGMDADKFYCAQDGEFEEFVTAHVSSVVTGDRAKATLDFKPNSPNGASRNFQLKKENGKWLLTLIECDMGIK